MLENKIISRFFDNEYRKNSLHLRQNFGTLKASKSNLVICSASVKYIFHKLVSSYARSKIN